MGGCVRDTLLGLTPDDWDITTNALPSQTTAVFGDCRVIETGLQHGTITVRYEDKNFEITTYRVDGAYVDSRHPDHVLFTPSVLEDVKRRDFTINALLWDPDAGILDLVSGIADLENNLLRCVGEPRTRFSEDALRILRALRFAAVYGLNIEEDTAHAAIQLADKLCAISAERTRAEIYKLFCGKNAAEILGEFTMVIRHILPEISVTENLLQTLGRTPRELPLRLALLLQHTDTATVLKRLKTDNATITKVTQIIRALPLPPTTDRVALKKRLHVYSDKTLQDAITLHIAAENAVNEWMATADALTALVAENPCVSVGQLAVNGTQLMALGLHGRAIGGMLEQLLVAVMEEQCENKTHTLLTLAKRWAASVKENKR